MSQASTSTTLLSRNTTRNTTLNTATQEQPQLMPQAGTPVPPHLLNRNTTKHPLNDSKQQERDKVKWDEAEISLSTIKYNIDEINKLESIDLVLLELIFVGIKNAEKNGHLQALLQQGDSKLVWQLSDAMGRLFQKLSSAIDNRLDCSKISAFSIRQICQGLSACIGSDEHSSIFSNAQLDSLKASLQKINAVLMSVLLIKGLPTELRFNAELMAIMNLLSRGIKRQVLSPDCEASRKIFDQFVTIVQDWPANINPGKDQQSASNKLDTRQLGKTMVQIKIIHDWETIDLDPKTGAANRQRLQAIIVGLCGGNALDQFTLLKISGDSYRQVELEIAPVTGIPVVNICNTIRALLDSGMLNLDLAGLSPILIKLMGWIERIPRAEIYDNHGQMLGNCCSFLRAVCKPYTRKINTVYTVSDLAFYKTVSHLLELIANFSTPEKNDMRYEQSLVSLISFVKTISKQRNQEVTMLRASAQNLVRALQVHLGSKLHTESLGGLLSALQYFGAEGLVPEADLRPLIRGLLVSALAKGSIVNDKASARLRLLFLFTALAQLPDPDQIQTQTKTQQQNPLLALPEAMADKLLRLWQSGEKSLPYLQAARYLAKNDAAALKSLQPVLQCLLNRDDGKPATLADIEQAIAQFPEKTKAKAVFARLTNVVADRASSTAAWTTEGASGKRGGKRMHLPESSAPLLRQGRAEVEAQAEANADELMKNPLANIRMVPIGIPTPKYSPQKNNSAPGSSSGSASSSSPPSKHSPSKNSPQNRAARKGKSPHLSPVSPQKRAGGKGNQRANKNQKPDFPTATQADLPFALEEFINSDILIGNEEKTALRTLLQTLSATAREGLFQHFELKSASIPNGFLAVMKDYGYKPLLMSSLPKPREPEQLYVQLKTKPGNYFDNAERIFGVLASDVHAEKRLIEAMRLKKLFQFMANGDIGSITSLSTLDTDVQSTLLVQDGSGVSLMMLAAETGQLDIVDHLLKFPNAALQMQKADHDGLTPFMLAAQNGHDKILTRMLVAVPGAPLLKSDGRKQALLPLMLAAHHGHASTVSLLLMSGASVQDQLLAQDERGNGALMFAVAAGHLEVVQRLMQAMAPFMHYDEVKEQIRKARLLATIRGNAGIISYLAQFS